MAALYNCGTANVAPCGQVGQRVVEYRETAAHVGGETGSAEQRSLFYVMQEQPIPEPSRGATARQLGALTMRSARDGGAHVIALAGELDLSSSGQVEQELLRVEATDAEQIALDLRELEFIDSTGVRLIFLADARARQHSCRLVIRRGPDKIQRLFVMTDLADRLPFVD